MKRSFIFLMCCVLGGGGLSSAGASSPGNPLQTVGKGRLGVSAEWEQNNRNLDLETESDVTSNRYWLKGTYGLSEWLDLSGRVGAVGFDVSTTSNARSFSFESDHLTFGFGGGLKLRLLHSQEQNLGVYATTTGSHLRIDEFVGSITPAKFVWNEFQSSLSFAKTYGFACPYLGGSYSVVDGELNGESGGTEDFRDPGGLLFGGIDFLLPSRYVLTLEVNGRIGGTSHEVSFAIGVSQSTK